MNNILQTLATFWSEHLLLHVVLIAITTLGIIVAMIIDGISGVAKAKERGEARTSIGYKKTADKARKYFTPFLSLVCIDMITSVVIPIPAFSMLWAAYCMFCEFVSVREKSWQKEEMRQAEKTMSVIIENKDDIAKLVAKMLFEQKSNEQNKQE